jgi:hypothetical protein
MSGVMMIPYPPYPDETAAREHGVGAANMTDDLIKCSFGGFSYAMPLGGRYDDPPCPAPATHRYQPITAVSDAWAPCCEGHAATLDVARYRVEKYGAAKS